jgi:hypothetical protein
MADRFDLDAIDADDALLDLLAAGGESARTAGEHDPAVKLLADLRLAVEVEDELPVETIDDPESFLARCAALNPVTDPFARKMAARGLALGVAAVAALSVSGVAAAVTGDPLSPYEKVIEKMVDAVRPETSFPKEQLDGMPVVDKTKIVKVGKDYQKKADERKAEEQQKAKVNPFVLDPPADRQQAMPPLLRPVPVEKPTVTQDPVAPEAQPTKLPAQNDPSGETTTDPTTEPSTDPTTEPSTEPSTPDPTTEPSAPPTTTDPTTEPSTPTTPPPTNGESGDTGTTNPTTNPTTTPTAPSGDTGETGDTSPAEDQAPAEDTQPPADDTPPPADDQKTPPADEKPAESPLDGLTDLVEKIVPQVLPTSTGAAVEAPSAEEFFGAEAKHSSGKVTTGSVKQSYVKGKHSTGRYAEGKHAAIARTHGSTDSTSVLTILGVVNKPTR